MVKTLNPKLETLNKLQIINSKSQKSILSLEFCVLSLFRI